METRYYETDLIDLSDTDCQQSTINHLQSHDLIPVWPEKADPEDEGRSGTGDGSRYQGKRMTEVEYHTVQKTDNQKGTSLGIR